jgi:hypothetical protein
MNPEPVTFATAASLATLVDAYFIYIEGEYHLEDKPGKTTDASAATHKVCDREPEPPTITGLALYLGFNSRQELDDYEANGAYAHILKRGRLRIETGYEKKLHNQSSAGAIFALKSMGWNERTEGKPADALPRSLTIEIFNSGPAPAANEKDVEL